MAKEANHCPGCWKSLPLMEEGQLPNFCPHCQFPMKPVGGVYRLEGKLGAGAFGTVYRCRHLENRTLHAIKIMRWDLVEDMAPEHWGSTQKRQKQQEFEQRFQREVELTKALAEDSWHIVHLEEAGSDPLHGLYYVMELLEGAPLVQFIRKWPTMSRRLAFSIMEQICLGVRAAHRRGVIHRDLKPENVIFLQQEDQGRFVKILDFGIAKVLDNREHQLTSRPVGTPLYMSPEQCTNRGVDQRADIYALGCLMYHMITGLPPFDPNLEIPQLMLQHVQMMPPMMREQCPDLPIPEGLDLAIRQALAKDPDERYNNVEAFWNAIQPFGNWLDVGSPSDVSESQPVAFSPLTPAPISDPISAPVSTPAPSSASPEPEIDPIAWSNDSFVPFETNHDWTDYSFQQPRFKTWGVVAVFMMLLGFGGLFWMSQNEGTSVLSDVVEKGALVSVATLSAGKAALQSNQLLLKKQGSEDGVSKPAIRLGVSRKAMAKGSSRRKLSRLERFLQSTLAARQHQKDRAQKRQRSRRAAIVRRVVSRARPLQRRFLRTPPSRRGRQPAIASIVVPRGSGWPGAQRVAIPANSVLAGPGIAAGGGGRVLSMSRSIWMWRTEVTQAQYKAIMGYNPSHFQRCGGRCPVENVTWHEAAAFSNAMSRRQRLPTCYACTGKGKNVWCMVKRKYWGRLYSRCKGWRLPTEAEWELAYRASSPAPYYTGQCLTSRKANFNGGLAAKNCPRSSFRKRTMPVGSFHPNGWGMYDMAGNVWEWVYDSHKPSLPQGRDPVRIGSSTRVVRGGGWYSSAKELEATARDSYAASKRGIILGFRPVRSR